MRKKGIFEKTVILWRIILHEYWKPHVARAGLLGCNLDKPLKILKMGVGVSKVFRKKCVDCRTMGIWRYYLHWRRNTGLLQDQKGGGRPSSPCHRVLSADELFLQHSIRQSGCPVWQRIAADGGWADGGRKDEENSPPTVGLDCVYSVLVWNDRQGARSKKISVIGFYDIWLEEDNLICLFFLIQILLVLFIKSFTFLLKWGHFLLFSYCFFMHSSYWYLSISL